MADRVTVLGLAAPRNRQDAARGATAPTARSGVHQLVESTASVAVTFPSAHLAVVAEYARSLGLTQREREVFEQTVCGRTNKEIATDLGVTHETVRTHWANICRKTRLGTQKLVLAQFARAVLAKFAAPPAPR